MQKDSSSGDTIENPADRSRRPVKFMGMDNLTRDGNARRGFRRASIPIRRRILALAGNKITLMFHYPIRLIPNT